MDTSSFLDDIDASLSRVKYLVHVPYCVSGDRVEDILQQLVAGLPPQKEAIGLFLTAVSKSKSSRTQIPGGSVTIFLNPTILTRPLSTIHIVKGAWSKGNRGRDVTCCSIGSLFKQIDTLLGSPHTIILQTPVIQPNDIERIEIRGKLSKLEKLQQQFPSLKIRSAP
jgi:hypothetical protein